MAGSAGKRDFCMVDMQLLRRMEEAGASGRDTRVLVAYLRHQEQGKPLGAWTFRGKLYVTSAKTVAANLGITENAVNKAISHLCKLGILRRISKGHRGKVALYELCESVQATEHLSESESVQATEHKGSKGAEANVENSGRVPESAPIEPQSVPGTAGNSASKGSADGTPLRVPADSKATREAEGEGLPSDEEEASHDQTAAEWLDEATERQGSRP